MLGCWQLWRGVGAGAGGGMLDVRWWRLCWVVWPSLQTSHAPVSILPPTSWQPRIALLHHITTYTLTQLHSYHWSGERAVMEGKWILSTGSNLKLWMMNQHKNDLIFFRPRCVVNLLMQKFKSNIFAISFVIDLYYSCILESEMILKILSI